MSEIYKVDRDRIRDEFFKLTAFDSESFHEKRIASYIKSKLISLGLRVEEDDASEKIAKAHPGSDEAASNIYVYL